MVSQSVPIHGGRIPNTTFEILNQCYIQTYKPEHPYILVPAAHMRQDYRRSLLATGDSWLNEGLPTPWGFI